MMNTNNLTEQSTSIGDYVAVLRRRKITVALVAVLGVVAAGLVTVYLGPRYRATARLLVDDKSPVNLQDNSNSALNSIFVPSASYDVETQVQVLQSHLLLTDASRAAGLPDNAAFGIGAPIQVDAKQVGIANVIELTIEARDPKLAEKLARVLPDFYLNYVNAKRQSEVTRSLAFARKRRDQENAALKAAELDLERFQNQIRVSNLDTERNQRIAEAVTAETDAHKAQAAVASAQARLDSLEAVRKGLAEFIQTPTTTSNTTEIAVQKDRIFALKTERARLSALYKPNYPSVQKLDAQITEMESQLAKTPESVTTTVKSLNPARASFDDKIAEARAALTAMQAELTNTNAHAATLSTGLGKYSGIERQLAERQRNKDQHKANVEALARTVEDLSLRETAAHPIGFVIARADVPEKIAPHMSLNLIIGLLVGLAIGVGFALAQDSLDDRLYTPLTALGIFGVPALGYIPRTANRQDPFADADLEEGEFIESYRFLRSNVQSTMRDAQARSILVTSARQQEGKSFTAAHLAHAMAKVGVRTVLIDANLRTPMLHEIFGVPLAGGLADVLAGRAVSAMIRETRSENLSLLTAGLPLKGSVDALNRRVFTEMLHRLERQFDLVIIDTSASLLTAESQILSKYVDGVVMVAELGVLKQSEAREAAEQLLNARARLLGVVFNRVDVRAGQKLIGVTLESLTERGDAGSITNGAGGFPAVAARSASLQPADHGVLWTHYNAQPNSAKTGDDSLTLSPGDARSGRDSERGGEPETARNGIDPATGPSGDGDRTHSVRPVREPALNSPALSRTGQDPRRAAERASNTALLPVAERMSSLAEDGEESIGYSFEEELTEVLQEPVSAAIHSLMPIARDAIIAAVPHRPLAPIAFCLSAHDPCEKPLTFEIVRAPEHGEVNIAGETAYYMPNGQNATGDSFSFKVNNGETDSNTAWVWIQLTNTPPTASDGYALLGDGPDRCVEIELEATDADGDALVYQIIDSPRHGKIDQRGATVLYRPSQTFSGMDAFTFRAFDGRAQSNLASVHVVRLRSSAAAEWR